MQTYAYIYMHVFKQTKINCSMYLSQTELLTQTANKENTEIKTFSTEKTPNQEHDCHPAPTILTILFCAWKQYRHFIHSFCRDPVGAGKILPTELCEFGKEKESLKSDISTSWCTQEGHVPPSQDGHPRVAHCQSEGCSHPVLLQWHYPTFSSSHTPLRSMGWMKHQGQ